MTGKDLVSIADLSREDLIRILDTAIDMKDNGPESVLDGQVLAMIFEKPSLRTRVSFEVAMHQLGGHAMYIAGEEVGLGKREPIRDMARVLSRYVNFIMARTFDHHTVMELARYASVPVINGLSDREHPCQALADLLTIREKKGDLETVTVAYIGDGNNVASSLLLACALAGAKFRFACPRGYRIPDDIERLGRQICVISAHQIAAFESPEDAVDGADVVYTDVWTSMGQEAQTEQRRQDFAGFQLTPELLTRALPEAILMHPMPVHHGEEFAVGLIDFPRSALIDQAENRLHAQKAVLVELAGAET